jgi:hypothetical protein
VKLLVFKTIKEATSAEITVKRSKFIANISPCKNHVKKSSDIKQISFYTRGPN